MNRRELRKKLLMHGLVGVKNSNNDIHNYLSQREGKLVRMRSSHENCFGWKVYRGLENELHKFVEYDYNGSVIEYNIHPENLRIHSENIVVDDPSINKYSIHSEIGRREMDFINKSGYMRETSI